MPSSAKISEGLKSLIRFEKRDWFLGHLKTFFQLNFHSYHGNVSTGQFRIWKLSPWIMAFYPVIQGAIDQTDDKLKVTLRTKMNSFGLTMLIVIMGLWAYGIIDQIVIQENNDWSFLWKRIIIGSFILILPFMAVVLGYTEQKRTAIKDLKAEIEKL